MTQPVRIRPIAFKPAMVLGLLREIERPGSGKTNTRRLITRLNRFGPITEFGPSNTPGYDWHFRDQAMSWHDLRHAELMAALPYAPGDLLWVREEHRRIDSDTDSIILRRVTLRYDADGTEQVHAWPEHCVMPTMNLRRAGMHLPRDCSRLTLRVTDVRVQRLQEISEADARAEGAEPLHIQPGGAEGNPSDGHVSYRAAFAKLWNSIHGPDAWARNDWVAAVTFNVTAGNVAEVAANAPGERRSPQARTRAGADAPNRPSGAREDTHQ